MGMCLGSCPIADGVLLFETRSDGFSYVRVKRLRPMGACAYDVTRHFPRCIYFWRFLGYL